MNAAARTESGLHVAIIMDGNGRWAVNRGCPTTRRRSRRVAPWGDRSASRPRTQLVTGS